MAIERDRTPSSTLLFAAGELKLGDGLDDAATLCPVVNPKEEQRIRAAIQRGVTEGARLRLDGRSRNRLSQAARLLSGADGLRLCDAGDVHRPRRDIRPSPGRVCARDLDAAITLTNRSRYGNTASLFTQSGAAARVFRDRIQAGMLGINLGVPRPMVFFPFGGWKNSFYGDSDGRA